MIIVVLTILIAAACIGFLIWLADFSASSQWRQIQRRQPIIAEENVKKSQRFRRALQRLRKRFKRAHPS